MGNSPRNSRALLWIIAGTLVAITMWFTYTLTDKIGAEERRRVEIYASAIRQITQSQAEENRDYTFESEIVRNNATIPMIWTDSLISFFDARNFSPQSDTDRVFITQKIAQLKAAGRVIVIRTDFNPVQYVYYDQSTILQWLKYVPYGQLALVFAFILFGYLSFSAARKAEQNQIWIGLAKETAHQLGTPISGILGWLELLQDTDANDPMEVAGIAAEIRTDVSRLELVADRFSKIGAMPKAETVNVIESLSRNFAYFRARAPRKVTFDCPDPDSSTPLMVDVSASLFDWVLENLLKNALDALTTGQGKVAADCFADKDWVYIDISDTGKGIPSNRQRDIFQPGFTTKKRGWGLGLSLARRIIEDYHQGKIFVKYSEEGKGTTFRIQLPHSKAAGFG